MLYSVDQGKAKEVNEVAATNEQADLHSLLLNNPVLLPGDHINPDDPRHWIVIGNEISVPDPETAIARWSLDLLFGDQDAVPTLIEVKRAADPRAKREVIAQLLDYAANGHFYWSETELQRHAERIAEQAGVALPDQISDLSNFDSQEAYFARFVENLRDGDLRLVFFLDRAPRELTSIVEFLNRQMDRTEVLVVEAQLYDWDGTRLVQPRVFGYTEEARKAKRTAKVGPASVLWNEQNFEESIDDPSTPFVTSILRFHRCLKEAGFQVAPSRAKHPTLNWRLDGRVVISTRSDGSFVLTLPFSHNPDGAMQYRSVMAEAVASLRPADPVDISDAQYSNLPPGLLIDQENEFAQSVKDFYSRHVGA